MRVLWMEDNPDTVIKMVGELFQTYSVEIDHAKDYEECLHKIESSVENRIFYDGIILDYMMDKNADGEWLTGMGIFQLLRSGKINVEGLTIPVAFVTAFSNQVKEEIKDIPNASPHTIIEKTIGPKGGCIAHLFVLGGIFPQRVIVSA